MGKINIPGPIRAANENVKKADIQDASSPILLGFDRDLAASVGRFGKSLADYGEKMLDVENKSWALNATSFSRLKRDEKYEQKIKQADPFTFKMKNGKTFTQDMQADNEKFDSDMQKSAPSAAAYRMWQAEDRTHVIAKHEEGRRTLMDNRFKQINADLTKQDDYASLKILQNNIEDSKISDLDLTMERIKYNQSTAYGFKDAVGKDETMNKIRGTQLGLSKIYFDKNLAQKNFSGVAAGLGLFDSKHEKMMLASVQAALGPDMEGKTLSVETSKIKLKGQPTKNLAHIVATDKDGKKYQFDFNTARLSAYDKTKGIDVPAQHLGDYLDADTQARVYTSLMSEMTAKNKQKQNDFSRLVDDRNSSMLDMGTTGVDIADPSVKAQGVFLKSEIANSDLEPFEKDRLLIEAHAGEAAAQIVRAIPWDSDETYAKRIEGIKTNGVQMMIDSGLITPETQKLYPYRGEGAVQALIAKVDAVHKANMVQLKEDGGAYIQNRDKTYDQAVKDYTSMMGDSSIPPDVKSKRAMDIRNIANNRYDSLGVPAVDRRTLPKSVIKTIMRDASASFDANQNPTIADFQTAYNNIRGLSVVLPPAEFSKMLQDYGGSSATDPTYLVAVGIDDPVVAVSVMSSVLENNTYRKTMDPIQKELRSGIEKKFYDNPLLQQNIQKQIGDMQTKNPGMAGAYMNAIMDRATSLVRNGADKQVAIQRATEEVFGKAHLESYSGPSSTAKILIPEKYMQQYNLDKGKIGTASQMTQDPEFILQNGDVKGTFKFFDEAAEGYLRSSLAPKNQTPLNKELLSLKMVLRTFNPDRGSAAVGGIIDGMIQEHATTLFDHPPTAAELKQVKTNIMGLMGMAPIFSNQRMDYKTGNIPYHEMQAVMTEVASGAGVRVFTKFQEHDGTFYPVMRDTLGRESRINSKKGTNYTYSSSQYRGADPNTALNQGFIGISPKQLEDMKTPMYKDMWYGLKSIITRDQPNPTMNRTD